ncbi:MAG TPA: condensation domain-containing protein, partial [Candidatus Binatia bacterium]
MNVGDFVGYLDDLGIRLSAEGERLHVDAPKGKLPTDLRAQIAERKAEILAYLKQQEACNRFVPPPIKPRGSTDPAPLSFAQERLWFLEQLEPEAAVYNISRASRLLGNLSSPALEATLKEVVSRHESLRTAFKLIDGQPIQVVQPSADISIKTVDLSSFAEDARQTEIGLIIKSETERPFDLSAGQLLRCTVIRAWNDDHVVILTTHHIVSDAWSMGILTRELWTFYEAFSNGKPSPLELLPVQYSDYAAWQRAWLQGDVLQSQLDYWKERLKDLPVLNFPTDRPRKPHQ